MAPAFFVDSCFNLKPWNMNFFTRLSNGWKLAKTSFEVLKAHNQLIAFPVLSGIAMVLVIASFVAALMGWGWYDKLNETGYNQAAVYGIIFLFYVVNYFIVVFFNMALVHCTHLYFQGETNITVKKGLQFSASRIGSIFAWALFAGTIGALLKIIQENAGAVGKIITGLIGIVWNVATFFVVPIIAYENLGPIDAFKRSAQMMKEKWGESIGANFSFGLIQFVLVLAALAIGFAVGALVHPIAGIAAGSILVFLVVTVISAAQTIFVSAVYHNINGSLNDHFDQQLIDGLFEHR